MEGVQLKPGLAQSQPPCPSICSLEQQIKLHHHTEYPVRLVSVATTTYSAYQLV